MVVVSRNHRFLVGEEDQDPIGTVHAAKAFVEENDIAVIGFFKVNFITLKSSEDSILQEQRLYLD